MPWRHCIMPPTVKGKYERNQMVVGGGAPHIAPLTKIVNFLFFCFRWTDQLNFLSNRRECEWSDTTIANEARGVVCGEGDDSESPVKILLGMSSTMCSPITRYIHSLKPGNISTKNNNSWNAPHSLVPLFTDNNTLIGSLPDELGRLTDVQTMNFGANIGLSGSIPSTISSMTNLSELELYECDLQGTIPWSAFHPSLST